MADCMCGAQCYPWHDGPLDFQFGVRWSFAQTSAGICALPHRTWGVYYATPVQWMPTGIRPALATGGMVVDTAVSNDGHRALVFRLVAGDSLAERRACSGVWHLGPSIRDRHKAGVMCGLWYMLTFLEALRSIGGSARRDR